MENARGCFLLGVGLSLLAVVAAQTTQAPTPSANAFFNGFNSYAVLPNTLDITSRLTSFSFRTCNGGQLLRQEGSNGDYIEMSLLESGVLRFSFRKAGGRGEDFVDLGSGLTTNQMWHTVNLEYSVGNLTLSVDGEQITVASQTVRSYVLDIDLSGSVDGGVMIGRGLIGCVYEGPGVQLTTATSQSSVQWGSCPLENVEGCGPLCESQANLCYNGGVCQEQQNGNYTTCVCRDGWAGPRCTESPCVSEPCMNGATCLNVTGGYQCTCPDGFAGVNCEININECASVPAPCKNGGVCTDDIFGVICDCTDTGYEGPFCQDDVNECNNDPCQNSGTCFNRPGGFTCQCAQGWDGETCENELDECISDPCQNGATCEDRQGSYFCNCVSGFEGTNCETSQACQAQPCNLEEDCFPEGLDYRCECKPGYEGSAGNCREIDECASNPCRNRGTCNNYINYYNCSCRDGYYGYNCENTNECVLRPNYCRNGATCRDLTASFECVCAVGFTGEDCSENIDDCAQNTCQNGATCMDGTNQYTCNCVDGFAGDRCQTNIDDCSPDPCQNSGTCTDLVNDYRCECTTAWAGKNCTQANLCEVPTPVVCEDGKVCFISEDGLGTDCQCPLGYTGVNCADNIDECDPDPCQNNATCIDGINKFVCNCTSGWQGVTCEEDIDECHPSPCQHDSVCVNNEGSYDCFCRQGYHGKNCELDINECYSEPCQNGATCQDLIAEAKCTCAPGYTGVWCEREIRECDSDPCQNGGTCIDLIARYNCSCMPGWEGVNCEQEVDECESSPCLNGGQCTDLFNNYTCNCSNTGFVGNDCEVEIRECDSSPCQHGGICNDLINYYNCSCYDGFEGYNCETDIDECASDPCQNGATCTENSAGGNTDWPNAGGYMCTCVPGYAGDNCETDINECDSDPCQNGATCNDLINMYTCDCVPGFRGTNCEENIDECSEYGGNPCQNGARCVDGINDYTCVCSQGLGGKNCSVTLIGCNVNGCENNSTCVPYLQDEATDTHNYTCNCDNGFVGRNCEKGTTLSFDGSGFIVVPPQTGPTVTLQIRFRTTLPSGVLAFVGDANHHGILEIVDNKIQLTHFNGTVKRNVEVNKIISDGEWHDVTASIMESGTMSVCVDVSNCNDGSVGQTVDFGDLHVGGADSSLLALTTSRKNYVGCVEDIVRDGYAIVAADYISQGSGSIAEGCDRKDQCNPDPCSGKGMCTDEWIQYTCECERPYTGNNCNYTFSTGTFSNEDSSSFANFVVPRSSPNEPFKVSMFFRTRKPDGLLMFTGEPGVAPGSPPEDANYVAVQLVNGRIRVDVKEEGETIDQPKSYTLGGRLADGEFKFVDVSIDGENMYINVNDQVSNTITLDNAPNLPGGVLYIAGMDFQNPENLGLSTTEPFKGCIQDLRYNETRLDFYPLAIPGFQLDSPSLDSTGLSNVNNTCVSDDTCASSPCTNGGVCTITWNDFECDCPVGYTGKNCSETDFCFSSPCPSNSTCNNLDDGFECLASATFDQDMLEYSTSPSFTAIDNTLQVSFRTRDTDALLVRASGGSTTVELEIVGGNVHFTYNNALSAEGSLDVSDGEWHTAEVTFLGTVAQLTVDNGAENVTANMGQAAPNFDNFVGQDTIQVGSQGGQGYFKGCMEDLRVGGVLLPFFESSQIPTNASQKFNLKSAGSITVGCTSDDVCGPQPCVNGATCSDIFNDYNCTCVPGYSDKNCSTNIDECASGPCLNGATCQDAINEYSCDCVPGYFGDHCETEINECDSSPCQFNSTCIDLVNAFFCNCSTNYTGEFCEVNIFERCDAGPCQNGATCNDLNITATNKAAFECICPPGYEGKLCDQEIDYCAGQPCRFGATCSNNRQIFDYECACVPGYTDKNCSTNIDECASDPCENGAQCTDLVNGYTCQCTDGWNGTECNVDIDECLTITCENNGSCENLPGSVKCNCAEGYEGDRCELDIDECNTTFPCQNGARCNNSVGTYTCNCTLGYSGHDCDVPVCSGDVCLYGSTCMTNSTHWSCLCAEGYQGLRCENDTNECLDSPCQHDSLCNNTFGSYECSCSLGYVGRNCETPNCTADLCFNNGTCDDSGSEWACTCGEGYEGERCENDIDECTIEDLCQNGATCVNSPGAFLCNCSAGFKGSRCETPTCVPNPCLNSGICALEDSWSCSCTEGFAGERCGIRGPCADFPCQNGANCSQNVNANPMTFDCECAYGWDGDDCTAEVDWCASSPCENNGNCSSVNTQGFICTCEPWLAGPTCEEDKDDCLSNPCLNGATCRDRTGEVGVDCACTPYWKGETCDEDRNECEEPEEEEYRCPLNVTASDCENLEGNFTCMCLSGWAGEYCREEVPTTLGRGTDLGLILGPSIAAAILLLIIILLVLLLLMKSKRATRGTYSPSRQEMTGSRGVEMGGMLKPPPEERLI
ncbi:CRB1 [Branchiostoma lanceolatum]|uniref:CRB1 protein n=2 Tax=Branchiostoma lanceolatum TaxID=7740 RepID=A0A8K0ACV0_BRALA|nr:CRB1 [Branchiostoma lanceolatum]